MFRFLVEAIPNAALLTNEDGLILQANAESERLFGYDHAELNGQAVESLVPARYRSHHPGYRTDYARHAESRPMGHGRDLHALRKDGSEVPVEIALNPIRTSKGLMIVAVIVDITERKFAEEEMRTLNSDLERRVQERTILLQRFLDSLPGLYLILTPDFDIISASDAYLSATMTTREQIVGQNIFSIFPDNPTEENSQNTKELRESLNYVLRNAEQHPMSVIRYDIRNREGVFEERYWSPINSPVLGPNREVQYIMHRVEDVTAYMQHQAPASNSEINRIRLQHMEAEIFSGTLKVQELNRQLATANKELEAFSYSVSHDLRTPLRAIDGFSLAVTEDFGDLLPEEGQRYLQTIREGAQHMGALIDDLLAFSRLSRRELTTGSIQMDDLVRSALDELSLQHRGREMEIHVADLPPGSGDITLVRQVWLNLLSNAIKYTRLRNPAVIEISSTRQDGQTAYFVRDNGTGFDMRYIDKLFGVFQRLHKAEDYEGTGVGLAIVQRIIHRHGGRVWAEGKVDHGATFYFTLGDHS